MVLKTAEFEAQISGNVEINILSFRTGISTLKIKTCLIYYIYNGF